MGEGDETEKSESEAGVSPGVCGSEQNSVIHNHSLGKKKKNS